MKKIIILLIIICFINILSVKIFANINFPLETILEFSNERPGNITITPGGRIIFTISALTNPNINVKELLPNGSIKPFPNKEWASKVNEDGIGIYQTIGIKSTKDGIVWILDMGDIKNDSKLLPKLIGWDTNTNELKKVIYIPEESLGLNPFLQDFAVDESRNKIYIADMDFNNETGISELPAIIVVDIITGKTKRVLEKHQSVMPLKEPLVINDKVVGHFDSSGNKVIHYYGLNPISLDPESKWLYYGAMSGKKVYRVPSEILADFNFTKEETEKQVEEYSEKPFSDGFIVDGKGNVYVTDVVNSAIGITNPNGYKILQLDKEKLAWPDGLAFSPEGDLYIISNELNTLPNLNFGKDDSKPPYYLLKTKIDN